VRAPGSRWSVATTCSSVGAITGNS
jgi:hypothetical protein